MEPEKIIAEINRLGTSQKLILAQDIWDSIARDGGRLSMPEWQKKELEERFKRYQKGQMNLHDWRAVHDALRERHR